MKLPLEDVEQFFRLHWSLMFFVNQRLKVLDQQVATPEAYSVLPPETRIQVPNALLEHMDLIDAFADENPFHFDEPDLEIVRSWKHLVTGTFYAFRQLQKYMIFLSSPAPVVAYGVVALFEPFEAVIGPYLPRMLKTTLLPFKGRIVYDGFITAYNITFGGGIKQGLNQSYQEAKERVGIITSLPLTAGKPHPAMTKAAPKKRTTTARTTQGRISPLAGHPTHTRIVSLIDAFCKEHLNEEYGTLCRKLVEALARKRPSPLLAGKPETWACGIVRTIGWVNFLDDRSRGPSLKLTAIDKAFGVAESTGQGKSKAIRTMLKIRQFDHRWMLPSRLDDTSIIWMLEVNGLLKDIRKCPRETQETAFRKGLIPYVPADRPESSSKK